MLYRKYDGSLCEISRNNFVTDTEYYKKIYEHMLEISKKNRNNFSNVSNHSVPHNKNKCFGYSNITIKEFLNIKN